ncbi:MAG: DinB family protein [Flavobacteriales bacterium]|nr:DinB family protein [Flavobacteriales bacterium]
MDRKDKLLARFSEMEVERRHFLSKLEHLDPSPLATSPTPGAWSVAQVVLHLAIAEARSMDYLEKKLKVGGHAKVGADALFRLALLRAAMFLPLRYKAPAIVATVPEVSFNEACHEWDRVRQRMAALYAALPSELVAHDLYKHPVAGKIDVLQGLTFMADHVRHHREQVLRTIRQLTK